jgi:hypothetical protein
MTNDSGVDGSRALWQNQSATSIRVPIHVMQARVGKIDSLLRRATFAIIVGGIFAVPILGWTLYSFPNPLQRTGAVLMTIGIAFLMYQVRSHVLRTREATDAINTQPSAVAYRATLERHRQFYSGVWSGSRLLTLFPGLLIFLIGGAQVDSWDIEMIVSGAVVVALALGMGVTDRVLAHRYQTQIDDVDRLLSSDF